MTEDLLIILSSGGIAAALLVISLLLTLPQANRRANRCLALLLGVLVLNLIHGFYSHSKMIEAVPYLFMLGFPTYLGLGPLLYFYTQAQTNPNWSFSPRQWAHFIPLLAVWLVLIPVFLQPAEIKQQMIIFGQGGGRAQWGAVFIAYIPIALSIIGYSAASLIVLRAHRRRILNEFSSIEQLNLNWLRGLAGFMILVSLSILLPIPESVPRLYWFKIISVVLIFFIGHMGIRQPLIFHPRGERRETESSEADTSTQIQGQSTPIGQPDSAPGASRKYRSTGLDTVQAKHYWEQLREMMETEKLYLAPDLSLAELAQRLAIQSAQLSQVINSCAHMNFYDFINGHRIKTAQTLLLDDASPWSILDIAMESGFNSKSTFYAQFKKHVGMTPTAYIKR
ncbi:MAG: AraC family transcriptional regulator [Halieaceae bacterium]|nr:AraC family transcriptional regulator [Halieaceae bacterium]